VELIVLAPNAHLWILFFAGAIAFVFHTGQELLCKIWITLKEFQQFFYISYDILFLEGG